MLLDRVEREAGVVLRRHGKEYHGPCPFCKCTGEHFVIWPSKDAYWCRQCGKKGDEIQFLRDFRGLSFAEAAEAVGRPTEPREDRPLRPEIQLMAPSLYWAAAARAFLQRAQSALWSEAGDRAMAWLRGRNLSDDTIARAGLGLQTTTQYAERDLWGLLPDAKSKGLWLPRGVVIPWYLDGELWGLRIRRPVTDPKEQKYCWVQGGTPNTLYNADALRPGAPAVLVEGEIDALSVVQHVGVAAVATGSVNAGRRLRWIIRLRQCSQVLVAYDNDKAGDHHAAYWVDALENARRWRPYWADVNELAQYGVDLRSWVAAGLGGDPLPTDDALVTDFTWEEPERDLSSWVGEVVDLATWQRLQGEAWAGWMFTAKQVAEGWRITSFGTIGGNHGKNLEAAATPVAG